MDFNELREYNDYLEQVEDIIFNLCEGIDVKATEAKVDAYRKENAGEIARLNKRNEEEDRRIAEEKGSEWAPRRMSLDGSDVGDTPGPTGGAGGFGGMFGHTPGTGGAAGGGPDQKRWEHVATMRHWSGFLKSFAAYCVVFVANAS